MAAILKVWIVVAVPGSYRQDVIISSWVQAGQVSSGRGGQARKEEGAAFGCELMAGGWLYCQGPLTGWCREWGKEEPLSEQEGPICGLKDWNRTSLAGRLSRISKPRPLQPFRKSHLGLQLQFKHLGFFVLCFGLEFQDRLIWG